MDDRSRHAHNPSSDTARFSWQLPRETTSQQVPLRLDTSSQGGGPGHQSGQRFSYASTPIELQEPTFARAPLHRPSEPMIPQSPVTPIDTQAQEFPPIPSANEYPPEKRTSILPYNPTPPTETHPAYSVPYQGLDAATYPPVRPASQVLSTPYIPPPPTEGPPTGALPNPPYSPGPIPLKFDPESGKSPTSPSDRPVFSPSSFLGPNGASHLSHQPGQIAHPNMVSSTSAQTWKHGLCDCSGDMSTCLMGLFCPCMLYGRTSYRLSQRRAKKDPTVLLGHSKFNGACFGWCLSSVVGLWCIPTLFHRTRLRHSYRLAGSRAADVAESCCCCCCAVIRHEREVQDREEEARRWAGPAAGAFGAVGSANAGGFTRPQERMVYAHSPDTVAVGGAG